MQLPAEDWVFWRRVATVLSGIWVGGTELYSVTHYYFGWFVDAQRNNLEFGPALQVALVGVAVIFAGCLGVPWIANRKPTDAP